MEQKPAWLAGRESCKNLAAKLPERFKPRAKILWQLLVYLAAQALSKGGAFSCGRDSNLQVAATDHRTKKEIAVWNVVDAVADNAQLDRPMIDCRINLWRIRSGNH